MKNKLFLCKFLFLLLFILFISCLKTNLKDRYFEEKENEINSLDLLEGGSEKGEYSEELEQSLTGEELTTESQISEETGEFRYERVKRIVDGDTIELDNEISEVVRYIGVDTPETNNPEPDDCTCYGEEAKAFNKGLVEGKMVKLEFDVELYDKYKRTLAYVYVGENYEKFVQVELLKGGYAYAFPIPPNTKYKDYFAQLEKEAEENKVGLWGACENPRECR